MDLAATSKHKYNRLEKFNRFYFPYRMKKVGIALFLVSIVLLIFNKAFWQEQLLMHVLKSFFVIGLLIAALSKEKVEDELMKSVRFYSFKYAFVTAIVLSITMPYLDYIIDFLFNPTMIELKDDKGFFTIFQLVILQQVYFYTLKAFYNEK